MMKFKVGDVIRMDSFLYSGYLYEVINDIGIYTTTVVYFINHSNELVYYFSLIKNIEIKNYSLYTDEF